MDVVDKTFKSRFVRKVCNLHVLVSFVFTLQQNTVVDNLHSWKISTDGFRSQRPSKGALLQQVGHFVVHLHASTPVPQVDLFQGIDTLSGCPSTHRDCLTAVHSGYW